MSELKKNLLSELNLDELESITGGQTDYMGVNVYEENDLMGLKVNDKVNLYDMTKSDILIGVALVTEVYSFENKTIHVQLEKAPNTSYTVSNDTAYFLGPYSEGILGISGTGRKTFM